VPQISTVRFGLLEYPEDAVIHFPSGIPAFETETRFLAVERPDALPIIFLQSLQVPSLCFLTLPVMAIDPGYRLMACAEDLALLGYPTDQQPDIAGDLTCLAVLTIPENGVPTANLMAPILIRRDTRVGVQAVQVDSPYSHQTPLFPKPEETRCS
jgi:flagellar assembly factor FliW